MSLSLGKKISELRKEKGITQEELADKLGVSPQAVSKWENDLSCPDIMSLPDIADIFGITIDELFGKTKQKLTLQPSDQRKNPDDIILYVNIQSKKGDRMRFQLPIPLVKAVISIGITLDTSGDNMMKHIDFNQLLGLVEKGFIGKLVEIETAKGDIIEVIAE